MKKYKVLYEYCIPDEFYIALFLIITCNELIVVDNTDNQLNIDGALLEIDGIIKEIALIG